MENLAYSKSEMFFAYLAVGGHRWLAR